MFDRYRETRYTTWIYATKEPLKKLLTSTPPLTISTYFSRLSDPQAAYEQSSFIRPIDMREILIQLNEPPHEAIIPYVRLAKHTWKADNKPEAMIQFAGAAFITKSSVKDIVSYKKIKGLKWLNEDFKREEVSLKGETSPISLLIDKPKIKKKVIMKGKNVCFQISVEADVVLSEFTYPDKLKTIQKSAEKLLKSEIEQTYLEGIKADMDVYSLSEEVYRKHVNTWKAIEENGKIPLTKDSLQDVSVKITLVHGEKQRKGPTL
ncbi:hypothetical protein A3781_20600 [Bacillus badius]|nr:hypothetical protein A3781_20600 [Bacillus badius]